MNRPPTHTVIVEALEETWLTSDPAEAFDAHHAAARVESYLQHSGYTIAPELQPATRPTRTATAAAAGCLLACLLCAVLSVARSDWGWTALASAAAGVLTLELSRDLNPPRQHRRNR